jgi:hypothetical protein
MARLLWTIKQHVGPRPRLGCCMTFDTSRRRALLFGGSDPGPAALFGDTWTWDGENWTQVEDIGPQPRSDAALTYDPPRDRAVLFGGRHGISQLADTWEWNGEDWTQVADSGPAGRSGHAMVFDVARARIVLFGGLVGETTLQNDTWEWDGNEWVQVEDTGPDPRREHAMAFDATRSRIVLFGGFSESAAFGDTWEWDGTSWTQVANFGPPACFGATMVDNGRRLLLFGGASGITGSPIVFGFTWEWDGKYWTARQDLGPGPRWGHAMVFDTTRARGVLFGGTATPPGPNPLAPAGETWEQFEQGAPLVTGELHVQSLAVDSSPSSATPVEGLPFRLVATLAGVPAEGATVTFGLTDEAGNDLLGKPLESLIHTFPVVHVGPLVLAEGSYKASATVANSTQSAAFAVAGQPGPNHLLMLAVSPSVVNQQTAFNVAAELDDSPPQEIAVPLRVSIGGGPQVIWIYSQLVITPPDDEGTLTIDPQMFPTGQVTWTGSLGGSTASAVVTIT